VILPTRDRPTYLLAAAESVLAQTLPPAELLVVDDGSDGGAAEALGALPRSSAFPIRRFRGPRRGPAAARNRGLREAAGDLVAFLDDDDLWLPEKLEWQARWFAARPALGLVGTDSARTRDPAGQDLEPGGEPGRLRPVSRGALLRTNRLAMSSVVVRRGCFAECGCFEESLSLAQDWDMWLRIGARWEIGILPARLTIYRLHDSQRSADPVAMRFWEAEVVSRALARGGLGGRWLEGVARRRLAWARCRLGRALARRGEREKAVQELKQAMRAFRYHPVVWGALTRCVLAGRALAGARQA
jgi:glycosyltransferase involved in cell wall biosynthesis